VLQMLLPMRSGVQFGGDVLTVLPRNNSFLVETWLRQRSSRS
jgi:hypothetical protein